MRAFPDVHGLVFGAWGEASPDLESLLEAAAYAGALRHSTTMAADTLAQAAGALAWLLRRRWALTALRANARLLIDRLELAGRGADQAVARRAHAAANHAARLRAAAVWAHRGPRRLSAHLFG